MAPKTGRNSWPLSSPLGAASFLETGGEVLFCHLFTSTGVGRVSDLLSAYLKKSPVDERLLRLGVGLSVPAALAFPSEVSRSEPIQLECGLDGSRLVISVSFTIPENQDSGLSKVVQQLNSNTTNEIGVGVGFLRLLRMISDQVLIRELKSKNRAEITSVFELVSAGHQAFRESEANEAIYFQFSEPSESVRSLSQRELGDLDYARLLALNPMGSKDSSASTGEFIKISADGNLAERIRVLASKHRNEEGQFVVKGVTEHIRDEGVRVEGSDQPLSQQTSAFRPGLEGLNPFAKSNRPSVRELGESDPEVMEISSNLGESSVAKSIEEQLRKFTKAGVEVDPATIEDAKVGVEKLLREIALEIRRRTVAHKNAESAAHAELRVRDELLQQREAAISRLKDQVSAVTSQVEKMKKSTSDALNQVQWKMKYDQLQQSVGSLKDENVNLQKKLEGTKRLPPAGPTPRSEAGMAPPRAESSTLLAKLDHSQKQVEEFKRLNKQLMDKVNHQEKKKTPDASKYEDAKSKLEQSVRLSNERKAEIENLKLKLEESENERKTLRSELRRLQGLGRGTGGRSGSGGPPRSAA